MICTAVPTASLRFGEGWLYLAGFLDARTRRLVGWSVGATLEASLVCHGMENARQRVQPPEGLIIHTDRGSQFAIGDYRRLLEKIRALASMRKPQEFFVQTYSENFESRIVNNAELETVIASRVATVLVDSLRSVTVQWLEKTEECALQSQDFAIEFQKRNM